MKDTLHLPFDQVGDDDEAKKKAEHKAGRREGERRRDQAHRFLEARRRPFVLRGRLALLDRLLASGRATPDDVRDHVGELPEGIGPALFGAVSKPLKDAGAIRHVGYQKSRRPIAHARPVGIFEIADRKKCELERQLVAAQLAVLDRAEAPE